MVDFKGRLPPDVYSAIEIAGHYLRYNIGKCEYDCSDFNAVQAIIDALPAPMSNLNPVQFHIMLNKYGFRDAIDTLLPILKTEDSEKHAYYKAYLDVAQHYEFDMALTMFNEILDKFAAIDPALALSESQLRAMWLEASQV